jgi:hypothetical protein
VVGEKDRAVSSVVKPKRTGLTSVTRSISGLLIALAGNNYRISIANRAHYFFFIETARQKVPLASHFAVNAFSLP